MRQTISYVKDETSSTTTGIQSLYRLNTDVKPWNVERLEENLKV